MRPCVQGLFRPQDSSWNLPTILADRATGFAVPARCPHFIFGFSVSVGSGDRSPCAGALDAMWRQPNPAVTMLEEPVDKPGTTIGTQFSVLQKIRLPFLMSCDF